MIFGLRSEDLHAVPTGDSTAPVTLHVEAVEATFSRLVMQAFGQAPQQEALPTSARFFATVVFIRELMHHLHFPQIHVVDKHSLPPAVGPLA